MTAEEKNTNFNEFLMRQLSYRNYVQLPTVFEESPRKRTVIIENPEVAYLDHAIKVARLLAEDDKSKSPCEWFEVLINEYQFGKKNITIDEANLAKAGLEAQSAQ